MIIFSCSLSKFERNYTYSVTYLIMYYTLHMQVREGAEPYRINKKRVKTYVFA